MGERTIISHHFLRRTARKQRARIAATAPRFEFRVEPSVRGPFGWYVVRYPARLAPPA